jgi:hypothetical protein
MAPFRMDIVVTGYRVNVTPAGPSMDVYVQMPQPGSTEPAAVFTWHLEPLEVITAMGVACDAIRIAETPANSFTLFQESVFEALADVFIAKGYWTET